MSKLSLFSIITGLTALSFISCSDDEINGPKDLPTEEVMENMGTLFGQRIIEIDETTPSSFDWKLPKLGKFSVTTKASHDDSDPFNFRIETDSDGFSHLVCDNIDYSNIDLSTPRIYNLKLSFTDSSLDKELQVVLRKNTSEAMSPDNPWYFADQAIGWTINITEDFGVVRRALAFSSFNTDEQNGDITMNTQIERGDCYESGGQYYEQLRQSYSINVGIKGQLRTKNGMLSGSLNGGINESNEYTENYEYYVAAIRQEMAEVMLSEDLINSEVNLRSHLAKEFNNLLNEPDSATYKRYANDYEGIKMLYETFGTHVLTKGTFGGLYTIKYSRMENVHAHDIGVDVSASIKYSAKNPNATNPGDPAGTTPTGNQGLSTFFSALTNKMTSSYLSGDADMSFGESSYQDAIKAKREIKASGRSGSLDLDEWQTGLKDRTDWVLTRYDTQKGTLNDNGNNLIPLYELVKDKDSERYKKMVEYYSVYVDEKCPTPTRRKLILADFMMKTEHTAGGHQNEYPKPFGDKSFNNNQQLMYVPIYINNNGPKEYRSQQGYALDTDQDEFVEAVGSRPHYWYVAYGFENTVPADSIAKGVAVANGVTGLIDIRIAKPSEMGEDHTDKGGENFRWYVQRGDPAYETTDKALNENYIYLCTYNEKNYPGKEIITAIALCKNKKESEPWSDVIYASTYGAEWKQDWQMYYPAWSTFWDADETKCSDISEGFYEGGMILTSCDVHAVYSTRNLIYPLTQNLCWGETVGKDGIPIPTKKSDYKVIQLYKTWDE